jgi:hypothetical protein
MEKRKTMSIENIPERPDFKCMVTDCKKDTWGGGRGMCINHYSALSFQVKVGKTTWEQLEKEGRSKPKLTSKVRGERRSNKNPFRVTWSHELRKYIWVKR